MVAKQGLENYRFIPIGSLEPAPWNYKDNDPDMAAKLRANIKRNGQIVNVNVRELDGGKFEVIDGNHRLTALRDLKVGKVVCYNHGVISLEAAKRIAVELNETHFDSDSLALLGVLGDIKDAFPDDFEETIPESLLKRLDGPGEAPPIEPEPGEESGMACPHCGEFIAGKLYVNAPSAKREKAKKTGKVGFHRD